MNLLSVQALSHAGILTVHQNFLSTLDVTLSNEYNTHAIGCRWHQGRDVTARAALPPVTTDSIAQVRQCSVTSVDSKDSFTLGSLWDVGGDGLTLLVFFTHWYALQCSCLESLLRMYSHGWWSLLQHRAVVY